MMVPTAMFILSLLWIWVFSFFPVYNIYNFTFNNRNSVLWNSELKSGDYQQKLSQIQQQKVKDSKFIIARSNT